MEAFGKRVLARLKNEGLPDIGEDVVKKVSDALFAEAEAEVLGNDKAWDDIVAPLLAGAKSYIDKQIDKIDGKEG